MPKVTTEDCRNFLVDQVKQGVITGPWGSSHPKYDAAYVTAALTNPKNWKREYKIRPENDIIEFQIGGDWFDEPGSNFAWERRFECVDPKKDFDGGVAYIVFEKTDGTLVLGEDCGD